MVTLIRFLLNSGRPNGKLMILSFSIITFAFIHSFFSGLSAHARANAYVCVMSVVFILKFTPEKYSLKMDH